MKVEFDFKRRAITAELHRRRASALRSLASDLSMSSARQEIESEASFHEKCADDLMDYADAAERPVPIIANPRIDIDQADAPGRNAS